MIRILLAEDHHLVSQGLRLILEESREIEVIGQAADGLKAVELTRQLKPDVVLMDITMPHLNGIEATLTINKMEQPPFVLILSQHKRIEYVVQALRAGANGYLLKDAVSDELHHAIREVNAGRVYLSNDLPRETIDEQMRLAADGDLLSRLTPREREILKLVAEGNTNRQIAGKLGISVKTVEKHRFNLMEKTNIHDVAGLVRFAISNGLISIEGL